jgi:uncharacterized protein (DUF1015 family)
MAVLFPFRALRPDPHAVRRVASVPYDVVSTDEARTLASGNPLSFLHVTRSEIDLPAETNPYDDRVYAQAVRNLESLKRAAPLVIEDESSIYVYRLTRGSHVQTGIAGCFSVDEYERDLIKKHERTRKDKEDDRTRHIIETRAQTGVVFLTYRGQPAIDVIVARIASGQPLYDLVADDGVRHVVWRANAADTHDLVRAYAEIPALYIADGHHRAASAARARATHRQQGGGAGEADRFIAVAFPATEMLILPYHRIVRDLAGRSPAAFLQALEGRVSVRPGTAEPARQGEVSMFLDGRWYTLTLTRPAAGTPRADSLDVAVLERDVLAPVLQVGDIRTDKRIEFIGGARGTAALEQAVTSGRAAVAFSMYPVTIDDLMTIADDGGIMPPKSTWFEPKLRDGILTHLI